MTGGRPRLIRLLGFECRLLYRDGSVWLLAAEAVALTAGGWMLAHRWTQGHGRLVETLLQEQDIRLRDLQARIDKERQALLDKGQPLSPVTFGSRHGTSVGHYSGGQWMVQPLLAMAPLAIGETDLQPLGILASVDRWQGQHQAQFSSPLWQRVVRFDVTFVVGYLVPLLLIVLCAGMVAAEREAGVLPLRLAQGGGLVAVGIGRVVLRGVLMALLVALTVIVLSAITPRVGAGTAGTRLMLWLAGLVAYVAFWLALIVWVDTRREGVPVNLLACTGLWVVLVFAAPAFVSMAADAVYPIASRAEFERARRHAYQEAWSLSNDEVLTAFYKAHPDINPDRDARGGLERYGIYQMRTLEIMREELLPLQAAYDMQVDRHRALVDRLRFLSPLLLLHDLSTTAAGTDAGRVAAFRAQTARFLDEWDAFYISRIYSREPIEDLTQTPQFVFTEPPLADAASRLGWSALGLVGPAALLAASAVRRLQSK